MIEFEVWYEIGECAHLNCARSAFTGFEFQTVIPRCVRNTVCNSEFVQRQHQLIYERIGVLVLVWLSLRSVVAVLQSRIVRVCSVQCCVCDLEF